MGINVNFNVFFKLIKVHLLVSRLSIFQNAGSNNKKDYCLLLLVQLLIKCCVIYQLNLKYISSGVVGNSTLSPEHLHYIAKYYSSSVLFVML